MSALTDRLEALAVEMENFGVDLHQGGSTLSDFAERVEAIAAELRQGEWLPIASAPRGGGAEYTTDPNWVEPPSILLAFSGGERVVARWEWFYAEGGLGYIEGLDAWCEALSGEQACLSYGSAIAWQHLPPAPAPAGADEGVGS